MSVMPRIGSHTAIDGRRKGIRESREVQPMNIAKAAACVETFQKNSVMGKEGADYLACENFGPSTADGCRLACVSFAKKDPTRDFSLTKSMIFSGSKI